MKNTIVIKIGGVASTNLTDQFFDQVRKWQKRGKHIVLVHGGGYYISEMMERLQVPVTIKDGLRVTTKATLDITKMVLIGQVQPSITSRLQSKGQATVGLNAADSALLRGEYLNSEKFGSVGRITSVNTGLLEDCISQGYLPVVAPLGMTEQGEWLNVNADQAACKVAEAIEAEALYLLTDVPGVKKGQEWLPKIDIEEVEALKKDEIIRGGMIPKVESASAAVQKGVKAVHITNCITESGTAITSCGVSV